MDSLCRLGNLVNNLAGLWFAQKAVYYQSAGVVKQPSVFGDVFITVDVDEARFFAHFYLTRPSFGHKFYDTT